jgi:hypothetical protein
VDTLDSRSIRIACTCLIVVLSLISLFNAVDSVGTNAFSPHQTLTTHSAPCPAGAVCPLSPAELTVTTPKSSIPPGQDLPLSGMLTTPTGLGIPREPIDVLAFGRIISTATDDSGKYTLTLVTPSQEGDYEITASFPGDDEYVPCQASLYISVSSHIPSVPPETDFWPVALSMLLVVVLLVLVAALVMRKRREQTSSSQTKLQETAAIPQQQTSSSCRYCGGRIHPDSVYCDKCGSKLTNH